MVSGTILRTHVDFDNAILFQMPVTVWQNGEIIDYGGVIQSHNDSAVTINGDHYLKSTCEFRVR